MTQSANSLVVSPFGPGETIMTHKWGKGWSLADVAAGVPGAVAWQAASDAEGTSKRNKIFRTVVYGIIGVAAGGAALTGLGVIGGAPAVAAPVGGTELALTSGYEYLGAGGASTLSGSAAGATWAGVASPLIKAASMVGSVAVGELSKVAATGISKLLHPNAGMTAAAAMPAYSNQIADARQLSTPTLVAGALAILAVVAILARAS